MLSIIASEQEGPCFDLCGVRMFSLYLCGSPLDVPVSSHSPKIKGLVQLPRGVSINVLDCCPVHGEPRLFFPRGRWDWLQPPSDMQWIKIKTEFSFDWSAGQLTKTSTLDITVKYVKRPLSVPHTLPVL